VVAFWLMNRGKMPEMMQNGNAASNSMPSMEEFVKAKLPDGVELKIPGSGIEAKLIAFLNDPLREVDDTTWFNFDRLTFDTGMATLQPQSQEQLKDIAEVLKSYPNVHVKIGGYTDNVGDPAANQKLSQDRADNVMQSLEGLGVNSSRMEAEGYGEQHPVADNGMEEGRQQNRRIALRVTQR
jgi:outer membrane protein OmpA-like peptidoglycan-associated protein